MSAKIIALSDRLPAAGAACEPRPEPAQIIALPPLARTALTPAPADPGASSGAVNVAASVAALRSACRDLADNLAKIRVHAQTVRDSMGSASDDAEALVSTGTGIVDALRGVVALGPAFAEETARG